MASTAGTVRIVVDARMIESAGIGTYLSETVPRVIARLPGCRFTLLGDSRELERRFGGLPRTDVRSWTTPIYTVREQFDARRLLDESVALVWAPHFNIPLAWHGPLAVTVHDVAHLVLPQRTPVHTMYAHLLLGAVRRRASVVLCDSAFTEREFLARVGKPRRSVVCHLGVADHWFSVPPSLPSDRPYLLYVGNIKPHKNLTRLIEAFTRISPHIPHRLVIVGRADWMRTVDARVARLAQEVGDRVVFPGYAPDGELAALVGGCDALVLPSLYEGFGLPPLEALACGRAVAVSNMASLPEVCGPEAEYFDPTDVASIADALRRICNRPSDTPAVIQRRREWARRFSWDACADRISSELRPLLASGPS